MTKTKEQEIAFVKEYMIGSSDFRNCYIDYNKSDKDFITTIDELLDYCFNSEFDPYLDECYLDMCWLKDNETGLIYNVDDMWECYKLDLMEE